AEGLAGELAALPQIDGFPQRRGEGLGLRLGVRVADELGPRIGAALDAVEAGRQQRRVAEVGVDVGARYPALDPARLAMADDAKSAGAVVAAPGDRRRGPALGRVPLVGVDRRGDEQRELPDVRALAAEVVAEAVGLLGAADEGALPVLRVDKARVDVAR